MLFQSQSKVIASHFEWPGWSQAAVWGGAILLVCLLAQTSRAGPVELSPRLIALPPDASEPFFVDLDGDGRLDMLVIDPVQKQLLNFHQRPGGFNGSPDQIIPLPPQTGWAAACDVDAHPGLELLMSTATALVYYRQHGGLFDSELRTLIQASQVFSNDDFPVLTSLPTNSVGTHDVIPVISATQAVLYHRNSAYEWSPGPPLALDAKQTAWSVDRDEWRDPWTLGPNPAHSLWIRQSFSPQADSKPDEEQENAAIRKILADMTNASSATPAHIDRVDVDGDGRKDLVLWRISGDPDSRTDIYLFLRGPDQKLPERPTQVLHCRGVPIRVGSGGGWSWSPVQDLDGDGVGEIVLLELKTRFTSASGLVETALSHGLDWALTIRSFHHGAFSSSPDASVPVTMVLPAEVLRGWPIFIEGDFNGDGRPDLLVRRSDTQWNIFLSTTDGHWFAPQPAMTFNVTAHGYVDAVRDLNGDGLADIVWRDPDMHVLSIFLSPYQAGGKNP